MRRYKNNALSKNDVVRADARDRLLFEAALVFGINIICYFLMLLYQWMGDMSYSLWADIETRGGVLEILFDVGANVFFYLTSFLGTAAFFIGAAYVLRFVREKRYKKGVGASVILFFGMFVITAISLVVFLFKYVDAEMSGDTSVALTQPIAILVDAAYLLFRVVALYACAFLLSKKAPPLDVRLYAISASALMFLSATLFELIDTTIPYFSAYGFSFSGMLSVTLSYLLYVLHAIFGYIIVMRFFAYGGKSAKNEK